MQNLDRTLIFIVIFTLCQNKATSTDSSPNYCKLNCGNETHTMCKYKVPGPSCKSYANTFSTALGRRALEWHNKFRNSFAAGKYPNQTLPQASNMRLMRWDPELSAIVHRWLSQCTIDHDRCRRTERYAVGQNVWAFNRLGRGGLWASKLGFDYWVNEMIQTPESAIRSFHPIDNKNITHFTQLIWHDSYRVGCSEVTFSREFGFETRFFGCNYAPMGNRIGEQAYEFCPPCTACPEGTKCGVNPRYPYLCGEVADLKSRRFAQSGTVSNHVNVVVMICLLLQSLDFRVIEHYMNQ